ncbi:OsmC family peroxiredoxin [Altererythrobacter salegens]|uniref:OsmC family peroxiredoxin n=1 Tax=Croceibacterium salegens TaxID=1737568 RepID=A0A6I4SR02_9SPHN|nr:OsmC family protein [Croceibacterium salegens]MXO58264.1 OsmC family peroxiredoxin [Croceibacterium salegens]
MSVIDTPRTVLNGVNVDALLGARVALESAPPAAAFTWKATAEWQDGVHTRTSINGFHGLGEDHRRERTFAIDTDHPPCFAATDLGATPVEVVLAGLAGCLGAGIATVAENRGVKLHSVKAVLEADMDLFGILGIDADVRNGFSAVRVNFEIVADASDEDIRAIVAQSQKRSAVFDILVNPTNVVVEVN